MIKTIIFDLGGVFFTDGTRKFRDILNSKFNLSKDKVEDILLGDMSFKHRTNEITASEFWDYAKKVLNIDYDSEEIMKLWNESYDLNRGVVSIIKNLHSYKILYLSNTTPERSSYLQSKYHFKEMFDGGISSPEIKLNKPDIKIYVEILKLASTPAINCLFIDDKQKYLEPAKKLGMKTMLFISAEKLEKDLKQLNIISTS